MGILKKKNNTPHEKGQKFSILSQDELADEGLLDGLEDLIQFKSSRKNNSEIIDLNALKKSEKEN